MKNMFFKLKIYFSILLISFILFYSCINPSSNIYSPTYETLFNGFIGDPGQLSTDSFSFSKIFCSYDGNEIIILNNYYYVLFSKDRGQNWFISNKIPYEYYDKDITISKNGNCIYFTSINHLYRSTDKGQTWRKTYFPASEKSYSFYNLITCSYDGRNVIAIASDTLPANLDIFVSSDFGKTFIKKAINLDIDCDSYYEHQMLCSNDGKTIWINFSEYLNQNYDILVKSNDFGDNWQIISCPEFLRIIDFAISSDGKKAIVAQENSYLLITQDGGVSWSSIISAGYQKWQTVAMSDDGSVIYAANDNGYITISIDGGNTFTNITATGLQQFKDLSTTLDGKTLFAITKNNIFFRIDNFGQVITPYNPINLVSP